MGLNFDSNTFDSNTRTYELVHFDAKSLRTPSKHIFFVDYDIRKLANDMRRVIINHWGVAVAAPQLGVNLRMILIHDAAGGNVILNPIIETSGTLATENEGCLSLPGKVFEVERWSHCGVSGQDLDGNKVEFEAKDFTARVIQHEVDHLDGLMIDRFPEVQLKGINRLAYLLI